MLSVDQKMQISLNVLENTAAEIHNLVKGGVNMTPAQTLSLSIAQELIEKAQNISLNKSIKKLSSEPEEPPIGKTDECGIPCDVEP